MTATSLSCRPTGLMPRLRRLEVTAEKAGVALGSVLLFASVLGAARGLEAGAPPAAAAPPPPSMAVRPLAPQQAQALNAAIPLSDAANPAADPFRFRGDAAARAQALTCLASAIYYEAGNEAADGGRAVAQVVLNRVRHPAFPSSVCGVVFQGSTRSTGCQFTFTCDGSLSRRPDAAGWRRARALAEAALAGAVYAPVGWATHYHANYVVPYWAASLAKNAVVGAHLFYHWNGDWGRGGAFSQAHVGREASAELLRTAALAAEAATASEAGGTLAEAIAGIPGAEPIKLAPSMRGDKTVAVRFHLAARKAADEAPREDYAAKVQASDNLRWVLSTETASPDEAAFGRGAAGGQAPAAKAGGAATAQPN